MKLYPALCQSSDKSHHLTNQLYDSPESARKDLGPSFVRLATELPPIVLADPVAPKPKPPEEVTGDLW